MENVVKIFLNDTRSLSLKTNFALTLLEDNRSAVFEATTNFAISLPISARTCQMAQTRYQTCKLKPDLCNCVKTEIFEYTAPSQQPYKRGKSVLGRPL